MKVIWSILLTVVIELIQNKVLCVILEEGEVESMNFVPHETLSRLRPASDIIRALGAVRVYKKNHESHVEYHITSKVIAIGVKFIIFLGYIRNTKHQTKYAVAVKVQYVSPTTLPILYYEHEIHLRLGAYDKIKFRESQSCVPQMYFYMQNLVIGDTGVKIDALFVQLLGKSLYDVAKDEKLSVNQMHLTAVVLADCLEYFHSHDIHLNDLKTNHVLTEFRSTGVSYNLFIIDYTAAIDLYKSSKWTMSALPYCSPYILDFVSRDINPISREVDGYFRLLVILIEIIENTDISEWFIPSDLQLQMIDHIDAAEYVQDRREEVTVESQCSQDATGKLTQFWKIIEDGLKQGNPIMPTATIISIFLGEEPIDNLGKYLRKKSDYRWDRTIPASLKIDPYVRTPEAINEQMPKSLKKWYKTIINEITSGRLVIANNKYVLLPHLINWGSSNSLIFLGRHMEDNILVAVKIQKSPKPSEWNKLQNQYIILVKLDALGDSSKRFEYIPRVYDFVEHIHISTKVEAQALVMELLGPSLETYSLGFRFSLKTIKIISTEMITFLGTIHGKDISMNQLRPSDILIDYNRNGFKVVGFGLANHNGIQIAGKFESLSFAPNNILQAVQRNEVIRSDSYGAYGWYFFSLLHFLHNGLPWKYVDQTGKSVSKKVKEILRFRSDQQLFKLLENDMSGVIRSFYEHLPINNVHRIQNLLYDCNIDNRFYLLSKSTNVIGFQRITT